MSDAPYEPRIERLRLRASGIVQGIGFRPFVYQRATGLGLRGGVRNTPSGVIVEVEGSRERLDQFLAAIENECPVHARIDRLETEWLAPAGADGFAIWPSNADGAKTTLILPDLATCGACRAEICDPSNRRYRYPFTNCTHCGPRFSIIESIPYDRERTTMRRFRMCPACAREYHDPNDRRFHAQPNACPDCGPRLEMWDAAGRVIEHRDDALRAAADALRAGRIVALKGLGGFHLLTDAGNEEAVARLRRAKQREEKPLALMAPDLAWIEAHCELSARETRLLTGPEAPIVLLRQRCIGHADVAPNVAPGNPSLGVMLPYTPLHLLLLDDLRIAVVATSGNRSDEPICTDEREALERLRGIAELLLVHDRPIARPIDDSVARVILDQELLLRRARGYAPLPISLRRALPPILGMGAHLKSTVALSVGSEVFLSQHIGDLETAEAGAAYRRALDDLPRLYAQEPIAIACDAHPDYFSTRLALASGRPVTQTQHHHAHVVACLTENGEEGPALGVSWDGTGYGEDGSIWGGEFLRATERDCERIAHLRSFMLPGGDAAAREPRRSALGLLHAFMGDAVFEREDLAPVRAFSGEARRLLRGMMSRGVNCPMTSSAGRLFDAVASIIDLRQEMRYEGQAAMELEYVATQANGIEAYPFDIQTDSSGMHILDWQPLIAALIEETARGVEKPSMAARFHETLIEMIVAVARRAGETEVALTGGCFQNALLTERAVVRLQEEGFVPLRHRLVPPNDGGIALGQVVIAAARSSL